MSASIKDLHLSLSKIKSDLEINMRKIRDVESYKQTSRNMMQGLVITQRQLDQINHKCRIRLNDLYNQRQQLKAEYTRKYDLQWNEYINVGKSKQLEREQIALGTAAFLQNKIHKDDIKFILEHTHLFK